MSTAVVDASEPVGTPPRRRVLVVPKWYPWPDRPVFGAFCREHARALATRHDVVVLASLATPRPGFAAFRIEDAVEDGIRTIRVRYRRPFLRPAAMGFQLLGMLAALRRLRREGWRPDVVHAHVFEAAPPALALARLSRAPLAITEHYTGFQRGLVSGYDRWLAKWVFERADLVAPVSEELAGHLRELAPRATFEVVPNVVDTTAFAPSDVDEPAAPRLLNVAALAEKKGHRYLLEALAELRDATLDVVGDGELRGELERHAHSLGLADRVHFLGERGDVEQAGTARCGRAWTGRGRERRGVHDVRYDLEGRPRRQLAQVAGELLADRCDEVGLLEGPLRQLAVVAGHEAALEAGVVLGDRDRRVAEAREREGGRRCLEDVGVDDVGSPALAAQAAQGGEHAEQLEAHRGGA